MLAGTALERAQKAPNAPLGRGRARNLQRLTHAFGTMNVVLQAAVLATTSLLAMKSGRPRLLP